MGRTKGRTQKQHQGTSRALNSPYCFSTLPAGEQSSMSSSHVVGLFCKILIQAQCNSIHLCKCSETGTILFYFFLCLYWVQYVCTLTPTIKCHYHSKSRYFPVPAALRSTYFSWNKVGAEGKPLGQWTLNVCIISHQSEPFTGPMI